MAYHFTTNTILLCGESEGAAGRSMEVIRRFIVNVDAPSAAVEGGVANPEGVEGFGTGVAVFPWMEEKVKC